MDRHLLIAISNDADALHGVKFVAGFLSDFSELKVTLFASLPAEPANWEKYDTYGSPDELRAMRQKLCTSFTAALKTARSILERSGVAPCNIIEKSEPCAHTTDFHLALEGVAGLYDALVLGRRGVESLSQLFEESLTQRMFRTSLQLPCWACRRHESDRKNILLCVDGTPGPSRLADHISFILQRETAHAVTLFHVLPHGQERDKAGMIFNEATELLVDGGFPMQRIRVRLAENSSPARAILDEAGSGRYAVVGIGRHCEDKSGLRRLFSGSTGRAVIKELGGAAIWFAG